MKLTSIIGSGSGKMGGSVFSVRAGEQIVRTYQPKVANPSSAGQVSQRAKMKLASQLSAALATELFPYGKQGMKNSRNLFVADLFKRSAVTYANGQADIVMASVRLTSSRLDMFAANVSRNANTATVSGYLFPDYAGRVVGMRAVVVGRDGNTLEPYIAAKKTITIGSDGNFSENFSIETSAAVTLYLYAYMPQSMDIVQQYGEMEMNEATAVLLATSVREVPSDYKFSLTRAYPLATV